jgi:SAM-dependent methyltransferase
VPEPTSPYATPRDIASPADCAFYHSMDIPGVGEVRGFYDLRGKLDEYLGPVDFAGKRVLEIGPGSGYLSFEMEARGAEVVSVELSEAIPWDYVPYDHPELESWLAQQREFMHRQRNGYWLAHRARGSKARVHYGSGYDLPPQLGRFDVAVIAAVLLHNRDPMGILANCARITDSTMVVVDQHDEDLDARGEPLLKLIPTRDNLMVHTWWHLSRRAVRGYLDVLGWGVVHESVHVEMFDPNPADAGVAAIPQPHFTIVAERR